jgi:hypothetical protein
MYLKRPSQIIKNVANSSGSFINLFVDLELELRYLESDISQPTNLADRFLVDVNQNINILKHRIVNTSIRRSLVSKDLNLLSNGDFARSTLNADLSVASSDPYWFVGFRSATTGPTVVAEGISGGNCLKWTINTPSAWSIRLESLFKIPVEAGEQLLFNALYRTDKIDNVAQMTYRYEFYDDNNVLISTLNYFDFFTSAVGVQNIDNTQWRMPRGLGVMQVPAGAKTVKPILIVANTSGTTFWLDDIQFSKTK